MAETSQPLHRLAERTMHVTRQVLNDQRRIHTNGSRSTGRKTPTWKTVTGSVPSHTDESRRNTTGVCAMHACYSPILKSQFSDLQAILDGQGMGLPVTTTGVQALNVLVSEAAAL